MTTPTSADDSAADPDRIGLREESNWDAGGVTWGRDSGDDATAVAGKDVSDDEGSNELNG